MELLIIMIVVIVYTIACGFLGYRQGLKWTRLAKRRCKMSEIHICQLASEPGEYECREAIASEGRACKRCNIDCYRAGWSRKEVTLDNKKRCQIKKSYPMNENKAKVSR